MPTYSYRCTACDHAFDIQQSFSDDTLAECPNCGGALRKIFSPVGVSFSGSGFYRNDSRAPVKTAAGSESGSGSAAAPSTTPAAAPAASSASGGSGSSSASTSTT